MNFKVMLKIAKAIECQVLKHHETGLSGVCDRVKVTWHLDVEEVILMFYL